MYLINQVVKQGNSLCIRIPNKISKILGIKEWDMVELDIKKYEGVVNQEIINAFLKLREKKKELQKYSREKIILFATLNANRNRGIKDFKDEKEIRQKIKHYEGKIRKEFGQKILDDYNEFLEFIRKQEK